MELSDCHPSHKVVEHWNDWGDDRHQPMYQCTVCEEDACSMCPLYDDDPLRKTCLGYSWLLARKITGPDGITRTVRNSGTGWPKPANRRNQ